MIPAVQMSPSYSNFLTMVVNVLRKTCLYLQNNTFTTCSLHK